MYSKEESKQIRQQFWIFFGKRYPRKWILYNTQVKEINLKFTVDNQKAMVSFDIETSDEIIRQYYYEKFESLKKIITTELDEDLVFESEYLRSSGKVISRIYVLKRDVNINNKNHWPEIFDFLNEKMGIFENFWIKYQDYIRS